MPSSPTSHDLAALYPLRGWPPSRRSGFSPTGINTIFRPLIPPQPLLFLFLPSIVPLAEFKAPPYLVRDPRSSSSAATCVHILRLAAIVWAPASDSAGQGRTWVM